MNKIINHPDNMVSEMLDGYMSIHSKYFRKVPNVSGFVKRNQEEKVSIVIGGGAGNEPWQLGYVGKGLADGAAIGNVYTAPPARAVLEVTKEVWNKQGVLFLGGNHMGDVMNFELVSELASFEGIQSECLFVSDDIATETRDKKDERRGIAGIALAVKIAGAASELGYSLSEVTAVTKKAIENLYTYSVTTSPGYMPGNGNKMFEMESGHIGYGMGFNGETESVLTPMASADEIAVAMTEKLIAELEPASGKEIVVLVNGFGFTSYLELYIASRKIHTILTDNNIKIHDMFVDSLFAPQGTGGFSVSIMEVDQELKKLYDQPAFSPLYKK